MMPKSTVGESAQDPRQEFPVVIANMPATAAERRVAFALIIVLFVIFMMVAPFASVSLPRVDAFIPVLQSVLCIAELITAILLFSQYAIQPQLGLLALASGYIFSGLFAFLQTLAFPGAYAPAGLIGDPLKSAPYLFCLWHVAFPIAVIVYALSKNTGEAASAGKSTRITIGITIGSVLAVTAALTWMVTAGSKYLPSMFADTTRQVPFASYLTGSIWLLSAAALLLLYIYKRTSLAVWLTVTVFVTLPDLALSTLMTAVRFTLGWYTARTYALIASFVVLAVLLTETTLLYARLANAILLFRRERANRLMSLDAATSAMAHELRQPLTGIATMSGAAARWLDRSPPNFEAVRASLAAISDAANRAEEIISGVRELFKKRGDHRTMIHVDDVARQVLTLVEQDLLLNKVSVTTEYRNDLPEVHADRTQIQQVILNLVRNAIDAMASTVPRARHLRLATNLDGQSSVVLSVQDTGSGIATEDYDRVFEPFFTTKPNGMGLGLSICQTIAQDHGGSLKLVKTGVDGCVFELTLPFVATNHDGDDRHS
jgi:signal transduction histidine kinase